MDLKSTYNYIAEDWTKDHENDTWWIAGTDKFASYLKQGRSVLDVGCASGMKSEYLAKKGFVVTGVDFSGKMIELAQKRMPSRFFFVRDINEPLNLKSKFDGIFAQAVLLHVPKNNIKKVLGNLLELLKSNGYIYIAVKKVNEGQIEEQVIKENDYGYEYERFFSFYTLDEMRGYLEEFGLKIVYSDVISTGKTEWIQVIAQK
ncbi:MAG: hypothetical protein A2735_00325 [Candidatus Yanofskybacteria bacterium RIFCSPHIGHO2_01_FULL_41_21]|uniref:Methyltransferase domain-containing protein n=1 Tax=Candidatus Yanofskybacteria bacterium RIFCSPHIGHO2_01_FULL_41_21 TaxID=1802660 RepID=A0A1F8EBM5_9BACT|nr:MAG: hypothetical protein A2735_00325 [Candidatus Yanofskybacteria bacterium RIFCSPHIGHO2_01_FULL_41_21]